MASERIETGVNVFYTADRIVGQSRKTIVFGYRGGEEKDSGIVVKTPRPGFLQFPSAELALKDIKDFEETRERVSVLVGQRGGRSETIESQTAVIHEASEPGKVIYSRVQRWYEDSCPLSKVGRNIFDLPWQSLIDLKSIFQANIEMWSEAGAFLDLVGSAVAKRSLISKAAKNLFPLFFSENILIDRNNIPRVIDLSTYRSSNNNDMAVKLKSFLQVIGSEISVMVLDVALVFKKRGQSDDPRVKPKLCEN